MSHKYEKSYTIRMHRLKQIVFSLVLVFIVVSSLELLGYVGLYLLGKYKKYGDKIELPESVRPDWYYRPYFRLREILMEKPGIYPRFLPTFNLNYYNYPEFKDYGVIQNNEDGYRGPKINCVKGNKYRILFLGGSTTYGMVRFSQETFPAQTGIILNEEIKKRGTLGKQVEIINAGIIGGLLSDELHHYLYKYRYYKPDLVVISSGGNDAHIDFSSDYFTPDYTKARSFNFWQVEKVVPSWMMHSYFISFIVISVYYHPNNTDMDRATTYTDSKIQTDWFPKELKTQIKNGDLSYNPFYNNFNTLLREISEDSAQILVMPFGINPKLVSYLGPAYTENISSFNKIMKELAVKYNANWVDYRYESVKPQWWFDHCHVTAEGEKERAQLVANKILEIMKETNN